MRSDGGMVCADPGSLQLKLCFLMTGEHNFESVFNLRFHMSYYASTIRDTMFRLTFSFGMYAWSMFVLGIDGYSASEAPQITCFQTTPSAYILALHAYIDLREWVMFSQPMYIAAHAESTNTFDYLPAYTLTWRCLLTRRTSLLTRRTSVPIAECVVGSLATVAWSVLW